MLTLYLSDHFQNNQRPEPATGWFSLYPGAPSGPVPPAPITVPPSDPPYRTDNPLLGTYLTADPAVIKQHAYWLRAAGVDAIVLDWTNCGPDALGSGENGSLEYYCDNTKANASVLAAQLTAITTLVPPRLVVAMRIFGTDYSGASLVANEVYEKYSSNPKAWFKYNDGTANSDKPILIVFADFVGPWRTIGPQWTDPRFNIRYTNGYFQADPALTVYESAQRSYMANDWPYWSFVENVVDSTQSYPRHYRKVYRRMPTSPTEAEQSDMWTAIYDHTSNTWDGQQNAQDGKTPIIRTSSGLAGKRPRNVWVSAFNYRYARYSQPYEGLSTDGSVYWEPSEFVGWSIYNRVADAIYSFKRLRKGAPGKPVLTSYDLNGGSWRIRFQSANYPTEYCVSSGPGCSNGAWRMVDVTGAAMLATPAPFYLITRNPFGASETTFFGGM